MPFTQFNSRRTVAILALAAGGLLAGCAAPPEARVDAGKRQFRQVFDGPLVLEYELDTRYSAIDGKSCYAFLHGTLANQSPQRFSRQTQLEFSIYHGAGVLFRERSRLRGDLLPGGRVQFQFVESPLHKKHCPSYDRIEVSLTPVLLP